MDALTSDPDLTLERRAAEKYTGRHVDIESPRTPRFAATVVVEKVAAQLGHQP